MKVNYVGIIGGILAFISLALPWWTMNMSMSAGEIVPISISFDISIYPYKGTVSMMGFTLNLPVNIWYGWAALALIILGAVLGILGSIIRGRGGAILAIGGVLALLSIIIFAAGLQSELSSGIPIPLPTGGTIPLTGISLFSSGSFNFMGVPVNYSTYLSFGFWLALVAAIIIFAAIKKAEKVAPPPTPVAAPTPPPPP